MSFNGRIIPPAYVAGILAVRDSLSRFVGRGKAWKQRVGDLLDGLQVEITGFVQLVSSVSKDVEETRAELDLLKAQIEALKLDRDNLLRLVNEIRNQQEQRTLQIAGALSGGNQSDQNLSSSVNGTGSLETILDRYTTREFLSRASYTQRFQRLIECSRAAANQNAMLAAPSPVLLARRNAALLVLPVTAATPLDELGWIDPVKAVESVAAGDVCDVYVLDATSGRLRPREAPWLVELMLSHPAEAMAWFEDRLPEPRAERKRDQSTHCSQENIRKLRDHIDYIDYFALATRRGRPSSEPFTEVDQLPRLVPAAPRKRAALFLHNSYYHFNCLAKGLRQRGWDTLTVSVESPESPQQQYYHGEDLNLFHLDPTVMADQIRKFLSSVPEKFGSIHFCGMGQASFFPSNFSSSTNSTPVPWDLIELRRHGLVIGYMPSGCLDGGAQSSIRVLSGGTCERCVWQLTPEVCNDERNLAWGRTLDLICDWVGLECDYATPERVSPKTVYGPVVTALDPDQWSPDLAWPEDTSIERGPHEILIYHAVGNYEVRRSKGRDIKGTGAVMAAVNRLKAEGLQVQLFFAHNMPSSRVRFIQAQADIVVEQLNYGRYGANARESMMLGKPTICRMNPRQAAPLPPLRPILEAPISSADEESIYAVLRSLVLDPSIRSTLGKSARRFAEEWHGMAAAAERYERVIGRIRDGLPPETPELYPKAPN